MKKKIKVKTYSAENESDVDNSFYHTHFNKKKILKFVKHLYNFFSPLYEFLWNK